MSPHSGYHIKEDGKLRMRQIEINLGKACNNDCLFCANGTVPPGERSFLPMATVLGELQRAAGHGYRSLGFLGGEATIYPEFETVVEAAVELGFERITLTTNGRRLRDPARLHRLINAGVTRITLSIHSHIAEVEDRICNRRNAFRDKIQAIRNITTGLKDGQIQLPDGFALNSCIHGLNVRKLASQAGFFKKMGVSDIRYNFVMPENRAACDRRLVPRLSTLKGAVQRLVLWNESRGHLRINVSDVPVCGYPDPFLKNPHLFKRYVGEGWDLDTFVVMFGKSDYQRDQFRWKDRRQHRLKTHPAVCGECPARPLCEGIWQKYLELQGDRDIAPVKVPVSPAGNKNK